MASWIPAVRFFRFAARAPQKTPIVAAIGVFHFSAEALNLSKPPLRYGDDANDLYRRVFKKLRFLMRADIGVVRKRNSLSSYNALFSNRIALL